MSRARWRDTPDGLVGKCQSLRTVKERRQWAGLAGDDNEKGIRVIILQKEMKYFYLSANSNGKQNKTNVKLKPVGGGW